MNGFGHSRTRRYRHRVIALSLPWALALIWSQHLVSRSFVPPQQTGVRQPSDQLQSSQKLEPPAVVAQGIGTSTGDSPFLAFVLACACAISICTFQVSPSSAAPVVQQLGSSVQKAKAVAEATIETLEVDGEQIVNEIKRDGLGKTVEKVTGEVGAVLNTLKEEGVEKSVEKAANAAKARLQTISDLARELNVEKAAVRELRGISDILDKMQNDIYSESWMTLRVYPSILRSYIPLLSYYTNASCDSTASEITAEVTEANKQMKSAMIYDMNSLFDAVDDFEVSVDKQNVKETEKSFAFISLAYDRFCKVGQLYSGYSNDVLRSPLGLEAANQLKYKRLALAQPRARDDVLIIIGPDRGKTGKVIDLEAVDDNKPRLAVVKLDTDWKRGPLGNVASMQEVKIYPYTWVAVRDTDISFGQDFLAATLAAVISCSLTLPIDNVKVRLQSGLPAFPAEGQFGELFAGLPSNLGQYCIPGGIFLAGSNLLASWAVTLPFVDGNNPDLKLFFLIPAGVLANSLTMPIRVPFEEMNKLIQTGAAQSEVEAFKKVFLERSMRETSTNIATLCIIGLTRGIPFGALQVATYEFFKEKLAVPYEAAGFPLQYETLAWGALAGAFTGYATNPPDVIMTRTVSKQRAANELDFGLILKGIATTTTDIYEQEGLGAFNSGALERTLYLALEASLWFVSYEWLREVIISVS